MSIKQISVFIENQPGRLSEFAKVLSAHELDMRAMSIAESVDFGILRIIVNDPYNAARILQEEGYVCSLTSVLAAEISDEPGSLCQILTMLDDNGINLEYTYAFITRQDNKACLVLRVSDAERKKAGALLRGSGLKLLNQEDLD